MKKRYSAMNKINRRKFLGNSLFAAAGLSLPTSLEANSLSTLKVSGKQENVPEIIDTNIDLFEWPFRKLKYSDTKALVSKLRSHRITQAWAGSFEALFHKDIDGVNFRLAEECKINGKDRLIPFGAVNVAWPDWEEDLRRCHEEYKMPGIRVYPIYQTFTFDQPEFLNLVQQAAKRGVIIQIVGDMADIRHHHPIVQVRDVDFKPLISIMKKVPEAKIQLLYWNHRVRGQLLDQFISETNVVLDISRIEAAGEVGRLIEGNPWYGNTSPVPSDRLLFGSHAPYFPVETNIMKLFESPLTLDQMQSIMNANASRFLANA
jgi:predicted TIM-barrel fold metal-dependent hydrolase